MRPRIPEIVDAGAAVAIVGSGAPMFAQGFREKMDLGDVPILSDEKLESYKVLGFKRSLLATIHPRGAINYARALRRGHRQGKTQGDAQQQGGILVVTPAGRVVYRFVSEVSGDHAPLDDVVAAARAATART